MIFDNYQYLIMEQVEAPGNSGDSAAETGRYVTLKAVIGEKVIIDLSHFITEKGILRHPDSPWRENDISSDQVAPLLAAASLIQPEIADKIMKQLENGHTGNGDLISLGLRGQIRRAQDKHFLGFSDLPMLGQALLFKLPFRYSESKHWLEGNDDSSGDYLNFVNSLAFAKAKGKLSLSQKLSMKLISKQKCLDKVKHYYRNEPHAGFLIDLYSKALELIYVS